MPRRGESSDSPRILSGVTLQTALDDIAATAAHAVVAEVRDDNGIWRGGVGAPLDAKFRAGSITKPFVATVVLQLAAEKRLTLDDPVEIWLPGITIRHLLQHTSGIPDYGLAPLPERTWTAPELLALVEGRPALFEPGTSWSYSSTNYLLLGNAITQTTGNPYATEVEQRILHPLDLRDTSFPGANPHITGPHLHGYIGDRDVTEFDHSFAGAAGEIVSTTADLNHFFHALMTGHLLPPQFLTDMKTGLGLATRQLPDGTRIWGHNGGTYGYETFAWTTGDGSRQATIATTPRDTADLSPHIETFLAAAFRDGQKTTPSRRCMQPWQ